MAVSGGGVVPARKDGRVIVHFDLDCFYAAVFEAENPALKSLPLAVQQKQIIVTCNYEARRRGLYKLQLITEAKRLCPDVIIVLGEDISRFRDASKDVYNFLAPFSWSRKVEKLGFDEVWFDVTDVVDYNVSVLNRNDLAQSFFQLSKEDPTSGFSFDATQITGHTYPAVPSALTEAHKYDEEFTLRLSLGSHLARHMRRELEETKGYTATVGIATNKLCSKLVGNLNKPNGQTTLIPPYETTPLHEGSIHAFLDTHDIGKIPGVGFKTAQKLRAYVLDREAAYSFGLVYGGTKENVTVRDVRLHPGLDPEKLEKLLAGPGAPHGIGPRVWELLHGVDDSEVARARAVPRQISIEDSYVRLDTMAEVLKELYMLAKSLLTRMRIDLVGEEDDDEPAKEDLDGDGLGEGAEGEREMVAAKVKKEQKWLAHPRTLRLTTRPRAPLNNDGSRTRTFKRISHSAPIPNFIFTLTDSVDAVAEKLVKEALVPMFKRLHSEPRGWNLSLVNVAVTNMIEAGGAGRDAGGRDIGRMFRRQEDVLKDFRVIDNTEDEAEDTKASTIDQDSDDMFLSEGVAAMASEDGDMTEGTSTPNDHLLPDNTRTDGSDDEAEDVLEQATIGQACRICGIALPPFALPAHERFHAMGD